MLVCDDFSVHGTKVYKVYQLNNFLYTKHQNIKRHMPVWSIVFIDVKPKSLRTFIIKHSHLRGLRLSMLPIQKQDWMDNRPLYAPDLWLDL